MEVNVQNSRSVRNATQSPGGALSLPQLSWGARLKASVRAWGTVDPERLRQVRVLLDGRNMSLAEAVGPELLKVISQRPRLLSAWEALRPLGNWSQEDTLPGRPWRGSAVICGGKTILTVWRSRMALEIEDLDAQRQACLLGLANNLAAQTEDATAPGGFRLRGFFIRPAMQDAAQTGLIYMNLSHRPADLNFLEKMLSAVLEQKDKESGAAVTVGMSFINSVIPGKSGAYELPMRNPW